MSKSKKESFFWTSYSDLMTSLFFVMLVLFVLVIVLLHNKMRDIEKERNATQEQLRKILEIEASVEKIDSTYFHYDAEFKRHTLKDIRVSFNSNSWNMNDISQQDRNRLREVGRSITKFIQDAVEAIPEVRYLLIIEGQASRDRDESEHNHNYNHVLSYRRALALVEYWERDDLFFNDDHCEIIISGSGWDSPFRVKPDIVGNRANQRFVIHIIPKPGLIQSSNRKP